MDDTNEQFQKALATLKRGDLAVALELATALIEADAESPRGWLLRAQVHHARRDFKAAREDATNVVRKRPGRWEGFYEYARAALPLGRGDRALVAINRAIDLRERKSPDTHDKTSVDQHYVRAQANKQLGNLEEALDDAIYVRTHDPEWEGGVFLCGTLNYLLVRYEDAFDDFTTYLALVGPQLNALGARMHAAYWLDRHEQCIRDATAVIEMCPDAGDAWARRGLSHRALGNEEQAEADLARMREVFDNRPDDWRPDDPSMFRNIPRDE